MHLWENAKTISSQSASDKFQMRYISFTKLNLEENSPLSLILNFYIDLHASHKKYLLYVMYVVKVNIENEFHLHQDLGPGARLFFRLFPHPNSNKLEGFAKMKAGYQYDRTLIRISTPKGSSKSKYYTP